MGIVTETDNFTGGASGASTRIDPNGIQVQTDAANMRMYKRATGGHVLEFSAINGTASFTVEFADNTYNILRITIKGLPISDEGLPSDTLWRSNGILNITD